MRRELIARVRELDAERVKASRAGHPAMVQRCVYELARLAPVLAAALENPPTRTQERGR